MEFRVLGPVEVYRDGHPVAAGGPKQRALLALLLLNANDVVSRDRLLDGLWGGRLPPSASHTLDDYLSRLRKALGQDRLTRRPPGYVLRVEPDELDLHRFLELAATGQKALREGRASAASNAFGQALALWNGQALGHVASSDTLDTELDRLEELRLAVLEQRIEADLELGKHGNVIGELQGLVDAYPFREGLRAELMLALYRCDRQNEALDLYLQTRTRMVEQLGIEPSERLRSLHRRILGHDPSLEPAAAASTARRKPPHVSRRKRGIAMLGTGILVAAAAAVSAAVVLNDGSASTRLGVAPSVTFVDAATGRIDGELAMPDAAAAELRTDGRWIWDLRAPGVLFQIDARTRRVVHTFPVGTGGPFAIGRGMIWIVASNGRALLRVDPRFGNTERIPLSPESDPNLGAIAESFDVKFADRSVWVAHGLAQVDRVDPASGRILHRFAIRDASAIASGGGAVWIASADLGQLTKIDPTTNRIVLTAHLEPWLCCIVYGGGSLWASNTERIWKLDRNGEVLDTIKLPAGTGELAYGDGALWNTGLGTLVRIDARTDARREFQLGHILTGVTTSGAQIAVDISPTDFDQAASLKGRILQIRMSQDWIDDPDPAVGGAPGANEWPWLQQLLYATTARLFTYKDEPAPAGWQLVPDLAAGYPTVSQDGRTYTFRIRPGVRFSPPSNELINARTFKYSIERALSPALGKNAPAATVASDIVGVAAYRAGKTTHVAGIKAHGNTLKITLRQPAPDLPVRMALSYFAPVPIATPAVANGLRDTIPSAGPYYLALNDEGVLAILRRNPNYKGERPQHLDAIVITSQPDTSADVAAIASRKADYIAEPGLPGTASATPLLAVDELVFDTEHGPLASARLRRSINYALDRPAIAAALGDRVGDRYLPAGIPGYVPHHFYPLNGPDLARARSLAQGASPPLTLGVCSQPACLDAGRLVAADLRRIGMHIRIRQYSGDLAPTTAQQQADIVLARAFPPYPDPVSALRAALGDRFASRLQRISNLPRRERLQAAERFESKLLAKNPPAAALGSPTIADRFSSRVGCRTFQPLFFGVDLGALCLTGN